MADDPLFSMRNELFLGASGKETSDYEGNYQSVIQESEDPTLASVAIERDVLLYRAYISLGNYSFVLKSIKQTDPLELQCVRILAEYFNNPVQCPLHVR